MCSIALGTSASPFPSLTPPDMDFSYGFAVLTRRALSFHPKPQVSLSKFSNELCVIQTARGLCVQAMGAPAVEKPGISAGKEGKLRTCSGLGPSTCLCLAFPPPSPVGCRLPNLSCLFGVRGKIKDEGTACRTHGCDLPCRLPACLSALLPVFFACRRRFRRSVANNSIEQDRAHVATHHLRKTCPVEV